MARRRKATHIVEVEVEENCTSVPPVGQLFGVIRRYVLTDSDTAQTRLCLDKGELLSFLARHPEIQNFTVEHKDVPTYPIY